MTMTARSPSAAAITQALANECTRSRCGCRATAQKGFGRTHCPAPGHQDRDPSCDVQEKGGRTLAHCFSGCDQKAVIEGLRQRGLWPAAPGANGHRPLTNADQVVRYRYTDRDGQPKGAKCRKPGRGDKKIMWWERPDGTKSNGDIRPEHMPLFRLAELVAAPADVPVLLVEGEACADAACDLGFTAVSLPGGASQKDFGAALEPLTGRQVLLWPDNDQPGRDLMMRVAAHLAGKAASLRWIEWADAPLKGDVVDFAALNHTAADLQRLIDAAREVPIGQAMAAAPTVARRTLQDVMNVFQRRLFISDPAQIYVLFGAVIANLMPGDPFWLMVVGPPSSGKTETFNAFSLLPYIYMASTITEPALLSGTPKRETAEGATGGVLRKIGDFGILALKDFTSILSMNADARAKLLAALREIFDGHWYRDIGVDGGKRLTWSGKMGLIAGCTEAIDSFHSVLALLGERWCQYRPPAIDEEQQGRRALANTYDEVALRAELAEVTAGFFTALDIPASVPNLTEEETRRLIALASLVARSRSAVERDQRTREILNIPRSEAPARLVKMLRRLYSALGVMGLEAAERWRITIQVGLDSTPQLRRTVFETLVRDDREWETAELATAVDYPTVTARRAVEDLVAHGIASRQSQGRGKSDTWRITPWARQQYQTALGIESTGPSDPVKPPSDGRNSNALAALNYTNTVRGDFTGSLATNDQQPDGVYERTCACGRVLKAGADDTCDGCHLLKCPICVVSPCGCREGEPPPDRVCAGGCGRMVPGHRARDRCLHCIGAAPLNADEAGEEGTI